MRQLLFLIFSLLSASILANDGVVKGRTLDKASKEVLPYATIVLRDSQHKIVGGATSSIDGEFTIDNITNGKYSLLVSFMGYRDSVINVDIRAGFTEHNIGSVFLVPDAQLLKGVIVTARRPLIEQKIDKIIMNVANVISTKSSNGLDILRRAPGVIINPDGEVLLNGSKVTVWIDNRPSNLSGKSLEALLSGTDGGTIDKIEIISHPSAKYDASGSGGIINIITQKSFAQGINGSVSTNYGGAVYDRYYHTGTGSMMLNYRTDKTNTLLTYGASREQNFIKMVSDSRLGNDLNLHGDAIRNGLNKNHNYKLAQDFFIDKKNIIGFVVNGIYRDDSSKDGDRRETNIYNKTLLLETSKSIIKGNSSFKNISANINYTHYFENNKELTINADYGYYDISNTNLQNNVYIIPDNSPVAPKPDVEYRDLSNQYINIKSIKADYTQPLNSGALEAGVKWVSTNTDNNLLREDKTGNLWVPNKNYSNLFNYDEQISAAYITYSQMVSLKWVLKFGLRGEMTKSVATDRNYFNIFPTLYVGYNPNQTLRYGFSYTRRISRPGFSQLNPFRNYIDAYTLMEGNPKLAPEFSHNLSLNFGYGQHFSLVLMGNFGYNNIIQNTEINSTTGIRRFVFENQGNNSFIGASVAMTEYPITSWFTVNANLFGAHISSTISGEESQGWFGSANFSTRFYLPRDFTLELNGWGVSRIPLGYYMVSPHYQLLFSAKKDVMDGKGTISLTISDLFRSGKNKISLDRGAVDRYSSTTTLSTQKIMMGFSYRFGQGKGYKQRKVGNIDEAGRVNSGSAIPGEPNNK